MAIERLAYADLAERLNISAEGARAIVRRKHVPKQKASHAKALASRDHRTGIVRRTALDVLEARAAELEKLVTRLEAMAFQHRADYERERQRAEQLASEIVRLFADLVAAKEKAARLEGELAALRGQHWWLGLSSITHRIRRAVSQTPALAGLTSWMRAWGKAMIDLDWQAQLEKCQIKIADLEEKITSQRWKVQRLLKQQMNAACAQHVLALREQSLGRVQTYKYLIEARIAAGAAGKPRAPLSS
jgi:hypothetical protein